MRLSVVSWNVNSVRLRLDQVLRFLKQADPDILCIQEIKCQTHEFPSEAFIEAGYPHILVHGQKGWHGVALVSKYPFETREVLPFCRRGEARVQAIEVAGIELWNFYIPAGGDVPDRVANDKFDHKLEFYERLTEYLKRRDADKPLMICGDLNIAPGEYDVWSHRQMLRVVSHTPAELETFAHLMVAGAFHDPFRAAYPDPQRLFTWWSYRSADFRKSNRGLRLDHILLNPGLMARLTSPIAAVIHDTVREWERPSDHAPIQVELNV
ncbi:exodeoxyribonuclease III [Asticcacaulis sp. BYS171W]|uniref:Exodeoxyribonuclease III n=1 Tax=Asticcacaulis aquaticus TaxID=2984212 RepID=A0ABT5HSL8_9CAUL|nr:exodeoxyribonuclease III [Asticcacaulis aquaticus]MDC7683044.1 exodeoxyribonuclease III [Asticcacaulis aquaticus]